mgnify:FL=1
MCFSSKILFYSNVRIEIGYFDRPGGMRECHAVLHVTDTEAPLAKQLGDIIPISQEDIDSLNDRYTNVYGQH